MRTFVPFIATIFAAFLISECARLDADEPLTPLIELQSGPLTPALMLDGFPRPIHQIRLVVDAKLTRGSLILDGNRPEFDEFGGLVGGIQTPHVRGNGDPKLISEVRCSIELVKERPDKWRLYQIHNPKTRAVLRIATKGSLADGGPARIVVVSPGDKVSAVIRCTPYGLVTP
jgi:hypothetical protein